jgi:hypothetical protein
VIDAAESYREPGRTIAADVTPDGRRGFSGDALVTSVTDATGSWYLIDGS